MSLNFDKSRWKRVRFGDIVCNINDSVRDPGIADIDRVIAMEHMDPGELSISRWGTLEDGTSFSRRVKPGQTLFGKRRAYQRKVAFAEFDAICSGDILTFEADESKLLTDFLPFLVQSDAFFDHALGTSAGSLSPRTNWRDLAKFEFDLPPLDEQQRIADLLWAVERHKAQDLSVRGTLGSSYDSWLTTRLAALPTRPLGEFVELQNGRAVPSALYGTGDLPLLRPGDMAPSGETTWSSSSVCIPQSFGVKHKDWMLEPGDLVINMTAQSLEDRFLGRVCRMHDRAMLNQRIGRLRYTGINDEYLFIALRAPTFTDWVFRRSEGSKVKHMHWRHIQDYPLPVPDERTQGRIVEEHDEWIKARETCTSENLMLQVLRNVLTSEIFGVR